MWSCPFKAVLSLRFKISQQHGRVWPLIVCTSTCRQIGTEFQGSGLLLLIFDETCNPSILTLCLGAILRCYFWMQPKANQLLIRVKRHAEKIALAEPNRSLMTKGSPTTQTPYLVLKSSVHPRANSQLTAHLHFHPGLLDADSIDMLRIDFNLLTHGFPPVERMSSIFHNDYLTNCANSQDAEAFWADVLSGIQPQVSLFSGPLLKKAVRRDEIRDMRRLTVRATVDDIGPDFQGRFGFTVKTLCELVWANVLATRADADTILLATNGRDPNFYGCKMCMGQLDQVFPLPVAASQGTSVHELAQGIEAFRSVAASHAFIGMDRILDQYSRSQEGIKTTLIESLVNYAQSSFHQHHDTLPSPAFRRFPIALNIVDQDGRLSLTLSCVDAISMAAADVSLEGFVSRLRSAVQKLKMGGKLLLADLTSTCRLGKPKFVAQAEPCVEYNALGPITSLIREVGGCHGL